MARILGASLLIVLLVVGCGRLPASSALDSLPPGAASPAASAGAPTATPGSAAPTVASPSPSASLLPSPDLPTAWTRIDDPPDAAGDIVWTGSRFVASAGGVVLLSDDGLSWGTSPLPGEDNSLRRLAVGPNGIVGVGLHVRMDEEEGTILARLPMIWTSADGEVWRAAEETAFGAPPGREIALQGVAATARGWVAVGVERDVSKLYFPAFTGDNVAAVWTSTDGFTWARAPTTTALRAGEMCDVAVMGDRIVAVGGVPNANGGGYHAMAWVSDDGGRTWTRAVDSGTFDRTDPSTLGAAMTSVAVDNEVVVAGGVMPGDPGWAALAWWSVDGVRWLRATGEAMVGGQAFDLAPMSTGFVMTGPSSGCNGIRSSVDGRQWVCADRSPDMDGFSPYASATSGTIDVVVGIRVAEGEGANGEIWVRSPGH